MRNFYKELGMPETLKEFVGLERFTEHFNAKQKKAVRNIKWCVNDEWCTVNGWYDTHERCYQEQILEVRELFVYRLNESMTNVYEEGCSSFGSSAQAYIKDIRFCGLPFLSKVTFWYLVDLLQEAVIEVELTEDEINQVLDELRDLKQEVEATELASNKKNDKIDKYVKDNYQPDDEEETEWPKLI